MSTKVELIQISILELSSIVENAVKKSIESLKDNNLSTSTKDDLLTRKETSKLLKISLPTLNNWVTNGWLIAHRVGGRVYFKRSEIEQAMLTTKQ